MNLFNSNIKSKVFRCFLLCLSFILFFFSCKKQGNQKYGNEAPPIIQPKDGVFSTRGAGSFTYTKYEPLSNRKITVFYYIPTKGDVANMEVLFSFHGAERDGTIQRDAWRYFAEQYGFIVIAPQFAIADGYLENDYQFGSVFTDRTLTVLNEQNLWTYNIVENLFDYYKKETNSNALTYKMFGHSAGGQFVHRYVMAMPNARVEKAVAANPGSWTMPYAEGIVVKDKGRYGWPYAIYNAPFNSTANIKTFLGKNLIVHLGQKDNFQDGSMPDNIPSNAQGEHRLARGRFFYSESMALATTLGVTCNFSKAEVVQSGHSTLTMVYGRSVSSRTDLSNLGENNAFDLLFSHLK